MERLMELILDGWMEKSCGEKNKTMKERTNVEDGSQKLHLPI